MNLWSLRGQVCADGQVNRFMFVSSIISGKVDFAALSFQTKKHFPSSS